MVTSFQHQPEAQHPKSSAIHKYAGRLPHLSATSGLFTPLSDGYVYVGHQEVGWLKIDLCAEARYHAMA